MPFVAMLRSFCAVFMVWVLLAAPVAAQETMKITEMAVTTKISRGNPIDSVRRISSTSVNALYCFTRLVNPDEEETTITHVWYQNDVKSGEYELPVKGGKWRTYSKKMIDKESVGNWRVQAIDKEGNVLKEVSFRIN